MPARTSQSADDAERDLCAGDATLPRGGSRLVPFLRPGMDKYASLEEAHGDRDRLEQPRIAPLERPHVAPLRALEPV